MRLRNLAVSVNPKAEGLWEYRGNLREQRVRRDYTRGPVRTGEDIVRTLGKPKETGRNDQSAGAKSPDVTSLDVHGRLERLGYFRTNFVTPNVSSDALGATMGVWIPPVLTVVSQWSNGLGREPDSVRPPARTRPGMRPDALSSSLAVRSATVPLVGSSSTPRSALIRSAARRYVHGSTRTARTRLPGKQSGEVIECHVPRAVARSGQSAEPVRSSVLGSATERPPTLAGLNVLRATCASTSTASPPSNMPRSWNVRRVGALSVKRTSPAERAVGTSTTITRRAPSVVCSVTSATSPSATSTTTPHDYALRWPTSEADGSREAA